MYVDGIYDRDKDRIYIAERVNGHRQYIEYPAEHVFYYEDGRGKFRTIFGSACSRFTSRSSKEFQRELQARNGQRLFESDFNPVFRCLESHYKGKDAPKLHTAFFDIETDFDKIRGFAPTEDPFNSITAISIYLDWLDQLITLVMPPKAMPLDEAQRIASEFPNTYVFTDEKEMLSTFLSVIDDADVLSGWNSEGYDIPYSVNRVTKVLSKDDTRKFCLWGQMPKRRTFERYGAEAITFDLVGRIHMDYMQLYRKYTYEERHSYSLDAIGEYELDERKTPYEGTLDQLYNNDWRTFIEYNRQDVALLAKLDKKLKFLDLANQIAHENTVLLPTTMGAVAVTEQAIINEAHEQGLVVQNRTKRDPNAPPEQAAGAYVAYPKKGLHDWIGSVDINSLYPSVIRALNMAPETIIGQLRPDRTDAYIAAKMADTPSGRKGDSFAAAWEGLFSSLEYELVMKKDRAEVITVDWEGAETLEMTGAQIWDLIFNSHSDLVLSANGTIFTLSRPGVIPGLLERWYAERKVMQATLKRFIDLDTGLTVPDRFAAHDYGDQSGVVGAMLRVLDWKRLDAILESGSPDELGLFMAENDLMISNGKLKPRLKSAVEAAIEYWDKRQLVKKINLNSLYGAILNPGCRFFDKRIGQSTTLTGRAITKSMTETINECITGVRDHTGLAAIYNDTDSAYFSAWPMIKDDVEAGRMEWNKDLAVALYDSIADQVNEDFPRFMREAFHCPPDKGSIIRAGREIVATKGLFITKKRYALLYYDKDGKRKDKDGKVGEVKAMGLDLKRADTPKVVQQFLWGLLDKVLHGAEREEIIDDVVAFKTEFAALKPWEKGSPKRVNNLTKYGNKEKDKGKANMPGHVRAALNWNYLRDLHGDNYSMKIVDGQKAIVCKLKPNPMDWTAVAYPTDELRLPKWFVELPFDEPLMEDVVVTQKVENLLGVLGWDLRARADTSTTFNTLFDFE